MEVHGIIVHMDLAPTLCRERPVWQPIEWKPILIGVRVIGRVASCSYEARSLAYTRYPIGQRGNFAPRRWIIRGDFGEAQSKIPMKSPSHPGGSTTILRSSHSMSFTFDMAGMVASSAALTSFPQANQSPQSSRNRIADFPLDYPDIKTAPKSPPVKRKT